MLRELELGNYELSIGENLLTWYESNKRKMPWRENKDPYRVWLSEIILQQTQVKQGLPYFERFISEFPTIKDLAESSEEKVLKLWQGLGYYSRARNLYKTANFVHFQLAGKFPNNYTELLKLKGVGEYTAAAVASISFNEPVAVVDGNVVRVISRLFKLEHPFTTSVGKNQLRKIANQILEKSSPGDYNQAIMELGSLICKPQSPLCNLCPLEKNCLAKKDKVITNYPVKSKRATVKTRHLNFIVPFTDEQKTYLVKRTEKDIWQNMFTFPMIEFDHLISTEAMLPLILEYFNFIKIEFVSRVNIRHILTHRLIEASFYIIHLKEDAIFEKNNIFEVEIKSLTTSFAQPRLITKFLESKEANTYFNL